MARNGSNTPFNAVSRPSKAACRIVIGASTLTSNRCPLGSLKTKGEGQAQPMRAAASATPAGPPASAASTEHLTSDHPDGAVVGASASVAAAVCWVGGFVALCSWRLGGGGVWCGARGDPRLSDKIHACCTICIASIISATRLSCRTIFHEVLLFRLNRLSAFENI